MVFYPNQKHVRRLFSHPKGTIFSFSFRLEFECTNNMVEYDPLLLGLKQVRMMETKLLKVLENSELVVT
jgi:ribonuclease HI